MQETETVGGLDTSGLADPWDSARAVLRFTWRQLDKSDRKKLSIAALALSILSVADFFAVFLLAAVSGVVVASLVSDSSQVLSRVHLEDLSPQMAIGLFGGGALLFLSIKTILSWLLLKRIYLFIARLQPTVARRVYQTYLSAPYPAAQMLSRSQVGAAVTLGPASLLTSIRAAISMTADLTLIALMVSLLFFVNPLLFLASAGYFGILAYLTGHLVGKRMSLYGLEGHLAGLAVSETTQASVGYAPEIRLYGMARAFGERLAQDQLRAARVAGQTQVLSLAPRFVFELGVLLGFVSVAAVAMLVQEPADAAFTVALFTLTSVRLVPALQRLNGAWGSLKLGKAQSSALRPILRLPPADQSSSAIQGGGARPESTAYAVVLEEVAYRYPGSEAFALEGVNLTIGRGQMVALVGSTGSGKSTLAGVISGLVQPTSGEIFRPGGADWQERLAVVPQDVYLAPDTVRNNVALPVLGQADDDTRIWEALAIAQVDDVVGSLPGGLDAELGENGARLSGGEAQRLGLARALYRKPDLLVLDEATSSLDARTERRVAQGVRALSEECTLVVVAHRLATVRDADLVVFLDRGRIIAKGTFPEVVREVPAFAEAANLQGLAGAEDLQGEVHLAVAPDAASGA